MKIPSITLATLVLTMALSKAGSFGPGPWANGAYYPGQFDGVYSATAYGANLGGVIGFAVRGGSPTTLTNSASTNGISVDPNQNYFVIYSKGLSYLGETVGTVNNINSSVAGGLNAGSSTPTTVAYTNTAVTITVVDTEIFYTTNYTTQFRDIPNGAGGSFTAKLKADNAIITFSGQDTGIFTTTYNGAPISTNTFSLSGLKVAN